MSKNKLLAPGVYLRSDGTFVNRYGVVYNNQKKISDLLKGRK